MSAQVIVGYDGSKTSTEAVAWAAAEAFARHVGLRIVSCYSLPMIADAGIGVWRGGEALAASSAASDTMVQAMRAEVTASWPAVQVVTEVVPGPAGPTLVDGRGPGDVVVVGASDHAGLTSKVLGSTARWVVSHSHCPVVVVHGPASSGRPDRVVVGVDGSASSAAAITWAADEADRHGVSLDVVHTWLYAYYGTEGYNPTARDLTRLDAALVMDRAVEIARERCAADVNGVLVEESPSDGLLAYVRDGDLLVLGSRGRGAIRTGLFGSTANSVIEHAAVPVVVVPPGATRHARS